MLIALPSNDELYDALIRRDDRYDGQVFVCVSSTGIFCRLTCPARKPKRENCSFFDSAGRCIEAGFRPCKRCHPLHSAAASEPPIVELLNLLDQRQGFRWSEDELVRLGYDPSTIRRSFKRHFGLTFLEMARQRRLRDGFDTLSSGEKIVAAQHDASFDSPSAFRQAFSRLLGCAPSDVRENGMLRASWIPTKLGDMIAVSSKSHLHLLEFVDRKALPNELKRLRASVDNQLSLGRFDPTNQVEEELEQYLAGKGGEFRTPIHQTGTAFSQQVWAALREIPPGETRSYGTLAQAIGRPNAVRAVARANGANQIAILVPCHRVIGADGSLTGYGGGLWRKQKLIEIERQLRRNREGDVT